MKPIELSDEQWCLMDILARAKANGAPRVNRMEILQSEAIPVGVRLKLVMAGLLMPRDLVVMHGAHDFELTDAGLSAFNLRFGQGSAPATPTSIADTVILLPDLSGQSLQ